MNTALTLCAALLAVLACVAAYRRGYEAGAAEQLAKDIELTRERLRSDCPAWWNEARDGATNWWENARDETRQS